MSGLRAVYQILILAIFVTCGMIRLAYYNVTEQARQASTAEVRKSYCGLPITSSALIVPFVYLLRGSIPSGVFEIVVTVVFLLCAVAFITPISVRKPHGKSIAALVLIGVILVGLFFVPKMVS